MALKPTEEQIERESVEQVFGLTGGELNDGPWNGWAYNYDGVPEYACGDDFDADATYVTTLDIGCSYGTESVGERLTDADGRVWEVVATYGSSGETTCPLDDGSHSRVTRETARLCPPNQWSKRPKARRAECPFCEARIGEAHGVVYIGDSAEVVWQLIDDREEIMRRATNPVNGERPKSLRAALHELVLRRCADDASVGSCSTIGVVYDRIGRFILKTTDQGFRTDLEFDSVVEATAEMEALRADLEPEEADEAADP